MSTQKMIGQKVLVRQSRVVMKGDKIISSEVLYQRPVEVQKASPAPSPAAPTIKIPASPKEAERPGFMEPLGISPKADATRKAFIDDMKKNQDEFLEWEANQRGTWLRQMEALVRQREKYSKKRSWSAKDMAEVEQIDKQMKECEEILDRLEEEEWYSGEESE